MFYRLVITRQPQQRLIYNYSWKTKTVFFFFFFSLLPKKYKNNKENSTSARSGSAIKRTKRFFFFFIIPQKCKNNKENSTSAHSGSAKRKQAPYYHWYTFSHNDQSLSLSIDFSSFCVSLFHSSMEVTFSSKPQSLMFNPCLLVNSSSSFSYSRLRFVRRQFLGGGHNLRPPDSLRTRRRCRKVGLFVQSPRYIFRATLSSNPALIVVAVVTFSAVSFIYMQLSRRKKNAVEVRWKNRFGITSLLLFSCSQFGKCFFS